MASTITPGSPIQFLRRRDYIYVKPLGSGACGETVLIRDDLIDGLFVCKKYQPIYESMRAELFKGFVREIKLLHDIHHQNVVRVFNYYVYPESMLGYILMEYVNGLDIEEHLRARPQDVNSLFLQAVDGFAYLEESQILHRDIRPANLMVREDGVLKIIDLGFGKRVQTSQDFDKSISLNWWCEPPAEFSSDTYNHATEVYFFGKLFQKLVRDNGIEQFKHLALLERMCKRNPDERLESFADVRNQLMLSRSDDIDFEDHELETYRRFAEAVSNHISKIKLGAKYPTDLDRLRAQLDELYRNSMLEKTLPDCAPLLRALVSGAFRYQKTGFQTWVMHEFLRLLRSASIEKQKVALANLHARLDAIERYVDPPEHPDIPF